MASLVRGGTQPGAAVQIVAGPEVAALPFEFASRLLDAPLICRGPVEHLAWDADVPRARSVLVVKSEGSDGPMAAHDTEEAQSGVAIERLYTEHAPSTRVVTLTAPYLNDVQRVLVDMHPSVVHIVGQVFQSTAGVYVDFEGFQRRLIKRAPQPRARLDAHRLSQYLRRQPLVILDVLAPENVTDVVQMLLLRNRLAAELLESRNVGAVLATGLVAPAEREPFARALVSGIHENVTLASLWDALHADDGPSELSDLLARYSTALFALDPYARIFGDVPLSGSRR
jgi:hypothetical protein